MGSAGHRALDEVSQIFDDAAQLIRRHNPAELTTRPEARHDAGTARVRIARTLANLAHVTGREIQNYTRMMEAADHANGSHRTLPKWSAA